MNDSDAFLYNKNGQKRKPEAQRKAKSRAANKIVSAIKEAASNPNDRSAALSQALVHPIVQYNTKSVAISLPEVATAMHFQESAARMIERSRKTDKKRSRTDDDRRSFGESVAVAVVGSPEKGTGPSMTAMFNALSMPGRSGRRIMQSSRKKRKLLTDAQEGVLWSSVKARKGYSKVLAKTRAKLLQWFLDCDYIIQSPIAKDTLVIRNPKSGRTSEFQNS